MGSDPFTNFAHIPVHAFNPGTMTGAGNWTWLIPGEVPTLIDAGTGEARHLEALSEALSGEPLAQVLVTHAHGDHASGAAALAGQFGTARFFKFPWSDRDRKWPVHWNGLEDGQTIAAGDEAVEVVHTPGHAPDHVCFWHERTRTLFSGDLVLKGTSVYIPTNLGGDLADYLASLRRVLALKPNRLLPGHGPVIDEPESVLRGFIAHRHEREAQVLDVVGGGALDLDAIVSAVYRGLKDDLRPFARETIMAHLLKLEREGRARRHDDRWHIIEP